MASEFNVPLARLFVASSYLTRVTKAVGNIHSDQSSFDRFHFTNTLYLSAYDTDFRGGTLTFYNDNHDFKLPNGGPMRMASLTVEPRVGRAVLLSSGWENMHQVEPLRSGTRIAVPTFFTTCPVPPGMLKISGWTLPSGLWKGVA